MNKVTPQQIEDLIESEHYYTDEVTKQVTHCLLIVKGGYKFSGTNMGSAIPANFCAERGRLEARKNAIESIWPVLGYQLHLMQGGDWRFRLNVERDQLLTRIAGLEAGMSKAPEAMQANLACQLMHMKAYLACLDERDPR